MTTENRAEKDATNLTTPRVDAAAKAAESSEVESELTDAELAAVSGGSALGGVKAQNANVVRPLNPQPLPP